MVIGTDAVRTRGTGVTDQDLRALPVRTRV